MFTVSGREPSRDLTHDQLWLGLLSKAEDPVPFVRAITRCRVTDRGADWLVREILLRGDRVVERVTFHPRESEVRFERLSGPVLGTITNRVEGDDGGGLALRFTFALEVTGIPPGSREESEYAERMRDSYLDAIRTTIDRTRVRFGRWIA